MTQIICSLNLPFAFSPLQHIKKNRFTSTRTPRSQKNLFVSRVHFFSPRKTNCLSYFFKVSVTTNHVFVQNADLHKLLSSAAALLSHHKTSSSYCIVQIRILATYDHPREHWSQKCFNIFVSSKANEMCRYPCISICSRTARWHQQRIITSFPKEKQIFHLFSYHVINHFFKFQIDKKHFYVTMVAARFCSIIAKLTLLHERTTFLRKMNNL